MTSRPPPLAATAWSALTCTAGPSGSPTSRGPSSSSTGPVPSCRNGDPGLECATIRSNDELTLSGDLLWTRKSVYWTCLVEESRVPNYSSSLYLALLSITNVSISTHNYTPDEQCPECKLICAVFSARLLGRLLVLTPLPKQYHHEDGNLDLGAPGHPAPHWAGPAMTGWGEAASDLRTSVLAAKLRNSSTSAATIAYA